MQYYLMDLNCYSSLWLENVGPLMVRQRNCTFL